MSRFTAGMTILSYSGTEDPTIFQITAEIVDNLSTYFSGNVAPGNFFFFDGAEYGMSSLVKFVITEVIDNFNPPTVIFNAQYVYPTSEGPYEPQAQVCVIGEPSSSGLIQLPDPAAQQLPSLLVMSIQNYQIDSIQGQASSSNRIYGAEFTGSIDGVNKVFIPTVNFNPNTLVVNLNSMRQLLNIDYTLTNGEIVFNTAPSISDNYVDTLVLDLDPI